MKIFNHSLDLLERSMDMRTQNQQVIASNMANVDTPGFKANKLDFQASLEQAMQGDDQPAVIEQSQESSRTLDGNNVDMEAELSSMSRNRTLYNVTAQIMSAKFRQINTIFDKE